MQGLFAELGCKFRIVVRIEMFQQAVVVCPRDKRRLLTTRVVGQHRQDAPFTRRVEIAGVRVGTVKDVVLNEAFYSIVTLELPNSIQLDDEHVAVTRGDRIGEHAGPAPDLEHR